MARRLEPVARQVVDEAAITARDMVLDIATGTGNAALLAATRARTIAVDFEPALVRIGATRSAAVGWLVGDAAALPIADGAADVVLSVFGVMYAPGSAARELARCTKPGGRVVLASWVPGSLLPATGAAMAPFLPPPTGAPPSRWGDPAALADLLTPHRLRLDAADAHDLPLIFPDVETAAGFFVDTAGHAQRERPRLEAEGRWDDLHAAVGDAIEARATHRAGGIELRARYLLARLRRTRA
ncbi:class I SAM-dependent methyltransferase [Amycolatopsis sp. NPDC006125]|uniref:class I SAM-dependent methyltransferase n=1 Tax=Amycolatopsis sp. NPDC006125 TaxID=3156730 RepID=UPI0033B9D113